MQTKLVSVIIPCYNEVGTIRGLLDALNSQTIDLSDLEVIIADGGSTDGTLDAIADFRRDHPELTVRLVHNRYRTIPAGLNAAIAEASGATVIRLDAHSMPTKDYLEQCLRALKSTKAANAGGVWEILPSDSGSISRSIAAAGASPLGAGDARYRTGGKAGPVDTVPFGAYPREWLKKVGPFDETLLTNEDYEYNYRLREAGGVIWFDPRIRSAYFARAKLKELMRQYARYGFWKARMLLKHPRSVRLRQLIPPAFVLTGLALLIASAFVAEAQWLLMALAGAYAAVVIASAVYAAGRARDLGVLAGYPIAIAVMHFSWGSAFILGLLMGAIGGLRGQN